MRPLSSSGERAGREVNSNPVRIGQPVRQETRRPSGSPRRRRRRKKKGGKKHERSAAARSRSSAPLAVVNVEKPARLVPASRPVCRGSTPPESTSPPKGVSRETAEWVRDSRPVDEGAPSSGGVLLFPGGRSVWKKPRGRRGRAGPTHPGVSGAMEARSGRMGAAAAGDVEGNGGPGIAGRGAGRVKTGKATGPGL